MFVVFFFVNQKTAYEMRISDWSSDVCSSDLLAVNDQPDADPGPNRDIGEIVEPLPRAPANLGERRAVDVGVEPHRHRERRCDLAEHVGIGPAGLVGARKRTRLNSSP